MQLMGSKSYDHILCSVQPSLNLNEETERVLVLLNHREAVGLRCRCTGSCNLVGRAARSTMPGRQSRLKLMLGDADPESIRNLQRMLSKGDIA